MDDRLVDLFLLALVVLLWLAQFSMMKHAQHVKNVTLINHKRIDELWDLLKDEVVPGVKAIEEKAMELQKLPGRSDEH